MADDLHLAAAIAATAHPLDGGPRDWDALVDLVGDARLVLLGEASHGTHEFYRERARITRRLIEEGGFDAVAVEADWPDAYRVNRFVRGAGDDDSAAEALAGFRRFPQWMWRNAEVLDFVGWLRARNEHLRPEARCGFYGLDLYSLHASMAAVLAYLDRVDPEAARRARARYGCFAAFGDDPEAYAEATALRLAPSCEAEVVAELVDLRRRRDERLRAHLLADDEEFAAEQNARVVRAAERYYRSMLGGRVSTWNLRDTHMADTLDALAAHLGERGPARVVVWAHNSHLGDARATTLGRAGELDLGQLARERHPGEAVLVGFTTFSGTVSAASAWGGPVERKRVRPALPGSYERLLHATEVPRFLLDLRDLGEAAAGLGEPRLERAIGVIYLPETERLSHYFGAELPRQFDAVIHIDETRAVEPLERAAGWERGELPETWPDAV